MKITRSFVIDYELWQRLTDKAFEKHMSISELLREIITEYLR